MPGSWKTVQSKPNRKEKPKTLSSSNVLESVDDGGNAFLVFEEAKQRQLEARQKKKEALTVAREAQQAALAEEAARQKRHQEAAQRQRRAKDPAFWPTVSKALANACHDLHDKLQEVQPLNPLTATVNGRLMYTVGLVDRCIGAAVMDWEAIDAPLGPAQQAGENIQESIDVISRCFKGDDVSIAIICSLLAFYYGPNGAKDDRCCLQKGQGVGAKLAIQLLVQLYADLVASKIDVVGQLFVGTNNFHSKVAFMNFVSIVIVALKSCKDVLFSNAVVQFANVCALDSRFVTNDILALFDSTCHKLLPQNSVNNCILESSATSMLMKLMKTINDPCANILVHYGIRRSCRMAKSSFNLFLQALQHSIGVEEQKTDALLRCCIECLSREPGVFPQWSELYSKNIDATNLIISKLFEAGVTFESEFVSKVSARAATIEEKSGSMPAQTTRKLLARAQCTPLVKLKGASLCRIGEDGSIQGTSRSYSRMFGIGLLVGGCAVALALWTNEIKQLVNVTF